MSFVFSCLLYFFFVVLSFFFFKQKTAYEMRISDWSSDVCSSDLYSRPQLGENIGKAARAMLNFGLVEMRLVSPRDGWPNPDAGPSAAGADVEIGRASCRERVCQYVSSSVVAGSLTKNTNNTYIHRINSTCE